MECMSVSRPRSIAVLLLAASFCIMMAASAAAADPAVASGARSHTVQKGETLYAIARRYDVSVEALMSLNGIADRITSYNVCYTKLLRDRKAGVGRLDDDRQEGLHGLVAANGHHLRTGDHDVPHTQFGDLEHPLSYNFV